MQTFDWKVVISALDWKVVLPSGIALIALFVSFLVALRNWRYSAISVRYSSRNQYMNALFDIDRQLIARPELWAIYDTHEMFASRSNTPRVKARREAFLYLHMNLFETVYVDYNKILRRKKRHDKEFWDSWDTWIYQFFKGSSEARALFIRPIAQTIFSAPFVAYIKKILEKIAGEATLASAETSSGPPAV
jgi:hypothetical protein